MTVYYNEFDPKAAAWIRELILCGHIAHGVVDERSIEDVTPNDLKGFAQCHFFAGIGGWSYALRRAGWADTRRVWTMSCPCQPFSAAGKGDGFADERHLWPAGQYLIGQCKPDTIFGEQVASKDADTWIDLVHTDMEALGYTFGAVPFPSAGVGAPHIRDRLYWVADAESNGYERCGEFSESAGRTGIAHGGAVGGLGNPLIPGLEGQSRDGNRSDEPGRINTEQSRSIAEVSAICGLADAYGRDASAEREQCLGEQRQQPQDRRILHNGPTGPINGFWRDADWLGCRDGKWRPVEPGTFPLANGAAARVGRLRGYGNAINVEAAAAFIKSYMI